jgi:serine/threonine-protein kinase
MKVADLSKGVKIGKRFRLVKIIGRGSYGDVWLADVIDGEDLPPQIALKVYQQTQQSRATRVLLKEAEIAQAFHHNGLVRVFGAERIDGLVVMWMEHVEGDSLLTRLGTDEAPQPVSLDEVLQWLGGIAEALAYLHTHEPPLVHGDLKLDNILIERTGMARLVDFGQSRAIEDRFVATDGTGAWPYLAPEVIGRSTEAQGKRYVASDIYAAGVIGYRLLTGRFPRRTIPEILNLTPFPRPCELNPGIPKALEAVVLKCLGKRPDDRYQTGAELLAALEKARSEIASEARDKSPLPTTQTTPVLTVAEELADLTQTLLHQGKAAEAAEQLEAAMQRISTSPRILLIYAAAARAVGKLDAAHLVYQRAIRWLKQHGAEDDELRDPIEGQSELDVMMKRYDEAAEGFGWLAERWPQKRWYQFRHGVALGLAGQYRKSIEMLQKLHNAGPATALVCAKIGFAYMQLKNINLAVQYFNEALMLDEFEPVALYNLARIRAIQGLVEKANIYLTRLKQVDGAEQEARALEQMLHGTFTYTKR